MKNNQLYQQVRDEELLRGVSLKVFEILCRKPGLTVGQIEAEYAKSQDVQDFRPRNELAKRVSDLMTWGAIRSSGRTTCPITGRKAKTWEVTGQLPRKDQVLEKKNVPAPMSLYSIGLLLWTAEVCEKISHKWWLPWVWQAKAADVRKAILEAIERVK